MAGPIIKTNRRGLAEPCAGSLKNVHLWLIEKLATINSDLDGRKTVQIEQDTHMTVCTHVHLACHIAVLGCRFINKAVWQGVPIARQMMKLAVGSLHHIS